LAYLIVSKYYDDGSDIMAGLPDLGKHTVNACEAFEVARKLRLSLKIPFPAAKDESGIIRRASAQIRQSPIYSLDIQVVVGIGNFPK
jgi:hypothetical protein